MNEYYGIGYTRKLKCWSYQWIWINVTLDKLSQGKPDILYYRITSKCNGNFMENIIIFNVDIPVDIPVAKIIHFLFMLRQSSTPLGALLPPMPPKGGHTQRWSHQCLPKSKTISPSPSDTSCIAVDRVALFQASHTQYTTQPVLMFTHQHQSCSQTTMPLQPHSDQYDPLPPPQNPLLLLYRSM